MLTQAQRCIDARHDCRLTGRTLWASRNTHQGVRRDQFGVRTRTATGRLHESAPVQQTTHGRIEVRSQRVYSRIVDTQSDSIQKYEDDPSSGRHGHSKSARKI